MMQRVLVFSFFVALLCLPVNAYGAWIEDFDSYSVGPLTPQSDWESWGGVVEDPSQVVLTLMDDNKNAVAVAGHESPSTDLVHRFRGYDSGQYTFTAMQYIPSSSTVGGNMFILLNTYPASLYEEYSVQLTFDLAAGVMTDNYDASVNEPIVRDQWAELRFEIDLNSNSFESYYNGNLFQTRQWADVGGGGQLEIQGLDLYPLADDVSAVYYDNMSIIPIPEPGTALLMVIGAAVGLLYWRRR